MKMSKFRKIVYATATLAGTIIGVGLFALPYITSRVGIWIMLGYFIVLTAVVILIHQLFGEVALKTQDFLRLPSYAEIYLGRAAKKVAFLAAVLGFMGALLAYLIIGGQFLSSLLSPFFGGNGLFYTLLYFAVGSGLILYGIKGVSKIEFWGIILFFIALAGIFLKGLPFWQLENLGIKTGGAGDFFLPYGAILFSLWGASLIPEVEEMLKENKQAIRKVIPAAVLLAASVYLFFIFLIFGITGASTSEEVITGLKNVLGDGAVYLIALFGLLTTFTSFIALGLTLKKIFKYDLQMKEFFAWLIACFIPLAFFLAGFQDFIKIIGFVGGVMLAIEGIIIVLMYRQLVKINNSEEIKFRKFKFLTYPLIILLGLGIIYQIIYFIK